MRLWTGCALAALTALAGCSHALTQRPAAAAPVPDTAGPAVEPRPTAITRPTRPVAAGSRSQPLVALTFDSNLTPVMISELDRHKVASFDNTAVVDELEQLHVPATFFLAGLWVERYPAEVRRLAMNPLFELGSHSYAHRPFAAPCFGLGHALPVAAMAGDVQKSLDLLRSFTDHPVPYFRFPGGCYDQAALDAIRPTGVTVIQYDVASGDAFGLSVKAIVQHVVESAGNGSIVVLHITGGNTAPLTARALPGIVAGLRGRGFTLVKISDLLAAGQPVEAGPTGAVGGARRGVETGRESHRAGHPSG